MKKRLLKSALLAVAGIGLLVGSATATVFDLTTWNNNKTFATIDGVILTASSNADAGWGGGLTYSSADGLGVKADYWDGNSGVNGSDILTFTFSPAVTITNLIIADMKEDHSGYESLYYKINNGTAVRYDAASGNVIDGDDNLLTINLSGTTISLSERNGSTSLYGDFKVESVEVNAVNAVPEPAALLLFGTGICGLTAFGRRKLNK